MKYSKSKIKTAFTRDVLKLTLPWEYKLAQPFWESNSKICDESLKNVLKDIEIWKRICVQGYDFFCFLETIFCYPYFYFLFKSLWENSLRYSVVVPILSVAFTVGAADQTSVASWALRVSVGNSWTGTEGTYAFTQVCDPGLTGRSTNLS